MMRKLRERKYTQNQNFQKLVSNSGSDVYSPKEEIKLEEIEGLTESLNSLVDLPIPKELIYYYLKCNEFDMEKYK